MISYIEGIEDLRGVRWALRFLAIVAIAWIPAQIISYSVSAVYPGPRGTDNFSTPLRAITAVILLAPILETLIMRFNFWVLRKLPLGQISVLWVSALLWGGMHVQSENWGVPAIWAFLVFGVVYLRAERTSRDRALLLTTAVHVVFNSLSYGLHLLLS